MEREINEKELSAILGSVPIDPDIGVAFTPKTFSENPFFKKSENAGFIPVFRQRGLNRSEFERLASKTDEATVINSYIASVTVISVENFPIYKGGKLVTTNDKEKVLDIAGSDLILELFLNATRLSGLTRIEEEGLESSPQSNLGGSRSPAINAAGPQS